MERSDNKKLHKRAFARYMLSILDHVFTDHSLWVYDSFLCFFQSKLPKRQGNHETVPYKYFLFQQKQEVIILPHFFPPPRSE